jgi:hypothetical protein
MIMALDIELFGQLLPEEPRRRTVALPAPCRVREIARSIGLDAEEIGLISIDGVQSDLDDLVPADSRLCFFPYVSGG